MARLSDNQNDQNRSLRFSVSPSGGDGRFSLLQAAGGHEALGATGQRFASILQEEDLFVSERGSNFYSRTDLERRAP